MLKYVHFSHNKTTTNKKTQIKENMLQYVKNVVLGIKYVKICIFFLKDNVRFVCSEQL